MGQLVIHGRLTVLLVDHLEEKLLWLLMVDLHSELDLIWAEAFEFQLHFVVWLQ